MEHVDADFYTINVGNKVNVAVGGFLSSITSSGYTRKSGVITGFNDLKSRATVKLDNGGKEVIVEGLKISGDDNKFNIRFNKIDLVDIDEIKRQGAALEEKQRQAAPPNGNQQPSANAAKPPMGGRRKSTKKRRGSKRRAFTKKH